ncbi:MAG: hypothetical protein ACLPTF_03645 [Steroidobacteraceae bacterium]
MKQLQLAAAIGALFVAGAACADAGGSRPADVPASATFAAATSCSTIYQPPVGHPLLALQQEALNLRQADGGTLTAEHLAYLRAKLAVINKFNCK